MPPRRRPMRPIVRDARGRAVPENLDNPHDPHSVEPEEGFVDAELRVGPRRVSTLTFDDDARSLINRVESPDVPVDYTINPYRGCEHGCAYCYARPTHERLGFSAGLDFETRIGVKRNAPQLLRAELRRSTWSGAPIGLSGVTDPYQPLERRLQLVRRLLEVCVEARQPIAVITKNALVTRDCDLLGELAAHRAALVSVSITTLDPELAHAMEPRASTPSERLRAIERLAARGIPTQVMVAPVIPGLTDSEVCAILRAAADAGATSAGWVMLRLPARVDEIFLDWLRRHLPNRRTRVERAIRACRGGALDDGRFGRRMRGTGVDATCVADLFRVFAARSGLSTTPPALSNASFRPPGASNGERQLDLFSTEP